MVIVCFITSCSSQNKQAQMADTSMGGDTSMMMKTESVDSVARAKASTSSIDTVNRTSTVNADSVRQ